MGGSGRELMGVWTMTTQQWLRCAMLIANCYISLMDPRPDLAVPARAIRTPYFWWW